MQEEKPHIWQGTLAGLAGGLAASWVMNRVYGAWSMFTGNDPQPEQCAQRGVSTDPATIAAIRKLSRAWLPRPLTERQVKKAAVIVHYGIGTAAGAAYGAASEYVPRLRAGFGAGFGTVFFLGGEEVAVPLMGLSKSPREIPFQSHAVGLAAHLAYGVVTEIVRRCMHRFVPA
jgi:hypothetical protein